MSINYLHHEIERIRAERTRIMKRLAVMPETAPICNLLNERYFDLTWQQNQLDKLATVNASRS